MESPFSFDFGFGKPSESGTVDTSKSTIPLGSAGAASAEADAHIKEVRKRRGRPPSGSQLEDSPEQRAAMREELLREFTTLFDPDTWCAICRGPADLMLHVSKRDLWRIEDKELRPLGVSAAHTARLFLRTDPKWIALFMFSVSLTQIYGARIAIHLAQNKKEANERAQTEAQKARDSVTPFKRD
jgi:hypothetical protein